MNETLRQKQFLTLYVGAEHSVRQFLRLLVHDNQIYDDVCQAVALRLWEAFDTYDPSRTGSFKAWARGVAAKVVMEWRRAERHAAVLLAPEVIESIVEGFDRHRLSNLELAEQLEILERCIEQLPPHSRELVQKRYEADLPFEEVARQTDRSLQAVYKALQRVVRQLAECMQGRRSAVANPQ